jgi:hypothetical protein
VRLHFRVAGYVLQPHVDLPLTGSASSITCPNSQICATNTYFGIHGCCDQSALSACTIATSCVPSSAMSASCTSSQCSSDNAIAKCTASTAQECYKYLFVYDTTTMSQQGCTASGFTMTVPRSYGPTSTHIETVTVTASQEAINSPTAGSNSTASGSAAAAGEKKQSLGPIVGGTIGGCTIISLVALTAFLIHRRRLKLKEQHNAAHPPPTSQYHHHNSPEFDPSGFQTTSGWTEQDIKTWQQTGGVYQPSAPGQYVGVSEVHGEDRAVEVEAPEKTKSGHWHVPGVAPVEVEAPAGAEMIGFQQPKDEKKRWWRGPAEAP